MNVKELKKRLDYFDDELEVVDYMFSPIECVYETTKTYDNNACRFDEQVVRIE